MQFTLRSIPALALLPVVIGGPFTLTWWNSGGCSTGLKLSCTDYDSFQCCEEPPNPSSFPYAKVTSSGPAGFVVFTEVTEGGGCGLCTSTGPINSCIFNNPFETMFAASISQCQNTAGVKGLDGRVPTRTQDRVRECNATVPIDTAEVEGQLYSVQGEEREQMMADMLGMEAGEFHEKWERYHKGPTPTAEVDE